MATVTIFPTGPTWDDWDKFRDQAVQVDAGKLEASVPMKGWKILDNLTNWPGEGWTVVESSLGGAADPGNMANMIAPVAFATVRASLGLGGVGLVVAKLGAGGIAAGLGLVALGWFLLGRK